MPTWWHKKSSRHSNSKLEENNNNPHSKTDTTKRRNKIKSSSDVDDSVLTRVSPSGSSGFSGFDSDSHDKLGLPLPRPSSTSDPVILGVNGSGYGSASGSVSSVSSSGSSGEDHGDQNHHRGQVEMRLNIGSRSPGPGSRSPILGSRSPGPGSRTASKPTSPLHPRLSGMSLESPTGRSDDGRGECHPLPLPPGSPSSPSALTSARMNDNAHFSLATWKKGKLLGRGTFGHVYLGFNSHSGQMCAIKEVRVVSDDHSSKECLKQLNQEINLLSQLSHPNIVRYYGSELSEQTLSVYLEYVSGGSIHKLLQEYGAFKEPVIQNYTRQILYGLAYLHGRNTVHRDIKGANILVDPNGEIKLADFGMAKHITASSSMLSFKGSPYWMAPEVVMNMNGYSLAVDIWSLGCTILEMATSKPPWSRYEGVAAIFKIGNSKDMPDIPDHLSTEAKSFIRLCLQRESSARPTAVQLLDHPFLREQGTPRSRSTRDALSNPFDGSRSPPFLELHPSRRSSSDGDYVPKPIVTNTRTLVCARDDVRTITSLPVSPSSSPLRQYGPVHKSSYSPPHPTYSLVGQSGYSSSEHLLSPPMHSTKYTLDPFIGTSVKLHTPGSSPRTRPIL